MSILFTNGSPNKEGNTAELAAKLLAGKAYKTLHLVDYRLYSYGQRFEDDQFAEIVEEMKKAEYTMSRFARMYGMEYVGMATDSKEAEKIAKKL